MATFYEQVGRATVDHGCITCSCGALVVSCACPACQEQPHTRWHETAPSCCTLCRERARTERLGPVHALHAVDLSAGMEGGSLHLESLTMAISVQAITDLYRAVAAIDESSTIAVHVLTTRTAQTELRKEAPQQGLDGHPAITPGCCNDCHQYRALIDNFMCASCFMGRVEEDLEMRA